MCLWRCSCFCPSFSLLVPLNLSVAFMEIKRDVPHVLEILSFWLKWIWIWIWTWTWTAALEVNGSILPHYFMVCVLSIVSPSSISVMTFLQHHSAVQKTVRGQQHLALPQMSERPDWPWRNAWGGKNQGVPRLNCKSCFFLIIKHVQSMEKMAAAQQLKKKKKPSFTNADCTGSNRLDLWVWSGQSL